VPPGLVEAIGPEVHVAHVAVARCLEIASAAAADGVKVKLEVSKDCAGVATL
jgi:dihydroorotase-like cyclic amidohydrolase